MAVQATGNGTVYLGMTALTVKLRVVDARKIGEFVSFSLVTNSTDNNAFLVINRLFQLGELDNFGCVRLLMTIHACHEILSMGKVVAFLAFGHNFIPITFSRIVRMELLMAGGAVKLMLSTFVLEPLKLVVVAPAAFHRC